ncbi:hypothetical protein [Burkholderia sp. SRS-W-2-2016]|uniref:hypothetical protein n=1 Tax=Burkholderia sp. SRS-W-2-2016 TaxID=1926878 RepID=UPI00117C00E6|nr:hypothetical protein [Burkholderia sp. SRS-W-2-2016]
MKKISRSWTITGLCCLAASAISAYANLVIFRTYDGVNQPALVGYVHIAAAFVGGGLLARFIQGSKYAINEPTPGTVIGTYFIARAGEYSRRVQVKSAFFSTKRTAMLLGFLLCLMSQFVFVAAPDELRSPDSNVGRSAIRSIPA